MKVLVPTRSTRDGWQVLSWPFAAWSSITAITLGVLTVLVLRDLAGAPGPQPRPPGHHPAATSH